MSSVIRRTGFQSAVERYMVGDTKTSMVRVDHMGWLRCDGRSLLRSEYRTLFAVLGTDFGSVDADHFNLPDAEGRVVAMIGQADSISNTWVDGDMSGEERHTLTIAEMPSHRHGSTDVSGSLDGDGLTGVSGEHTHTSNATGNNGQPGLIYKSGGGVNTTAGSITVGLTGYSLLDATPGEPNIVDSPAALTIDPSGNHAHTIGKTGGNQPHNNIQPTIYMGNLFIYCGRALHNITDVGGINTPTVNRSYYPPSAPANRLY